MNEKPLSITKNIKMIELLKCEMLNSVAEIYTIMLDNQKTDSDMEEAIANLIILSYVLGDKLGFSHLSLDTKIIKRIKLGLIENSDASDYKHILLSLSKHIDKYREN